MKEIFENFDPNGPAQADANIFGLPSTAENADIIIVPVPWEVTTSYRPGTAQGPQAVFDASMQVDLYDPDFTHSWKKGIYMPAIDQHLLEKNQQLRERAEMIISHLEDGGDPMQDEHLMQTMHEINQASEDLNKWVFDQTSAWLDQGKKVGLLGGDHSTPYGFVKALSTKYDNFAVLQIDAHADLRQAYEGFTHSHASIMYNIVTDFPHVNLVQFGIRDYCDEEVDFIAAHPTRIKTFFDRDIKREGYQGKAWERICDELIAALPQLVYISFDIDGLDPKLCPNTGTPVPGGFELEQVFYLFYKLKKSGRQVIGFDVNEVSTGTEDAETIDPIVGARLLYKLCGLVAAT